MNFQFYVLKKERGVKNMKNKRKILILTLCTICILCFAGCSNQVTDVKVAEPVEETTIQSNKLTIEKVFELAQKGEELDWKDFEEFEQRNVGKSGYDIVHFPIDDTFELIVAGMWTNKPDGVELTLIADNTVRLDIRKLNAGEEDIQTFINRYSKN